MNAMADGNKLDPSKRVYVTCRCGMDGDVSISIQDEGQGFDADSVADPAPENLPPTSARGIYLMKMFMDEVSFQRRGSVVQMRKKPNASQMTRWDQIGPEAPDVTATRSIQVA